MRGLKPQFRGQPLNLWRPTASKTWSDTAIDTDEALDNIELDITCDADATTAIPVGSIIQVETEVMTVTATGVTLTVVRPNPVAHDTNKDGSTVVFDGLIHEDKIITYTPMLREQFRTMEATR